MNNLLFYVKGSAREPYRIVAEGAGESLRVFCSCPAGRKGGVFCKHVAYLMQGDVSALVSPSTDDVEELARRAIGSPLLNKASVRIDKHFHEIDKTTRLSGVAQVNSIDEARALYEPELMALGWTVLLVENDGERDEDRLELYAKFKNGKLRKRPSITLECVRLEHQYDEADWSGPDEEPEVPLKPRQRPFGVRTTGGSSVGSTWKHLPEALLKFLELARSGPEAKF